MDDQFVIIDGDKTQVRTPHYTRAGLDLLSPSLSHDDTSPPSNSVVAWSLVGKTYSSALLTSVTLNKLFGHTMVQF